MILYVIREIAYAVIIREVFETTPWCSFIFLLFFYPSTPAVDPNERNERMNLEKQNVNYATVAIAVVVVVFVLLLALILFAKRKSIKSCLKPEKPRNKDQIAVETIKANGENEKLAQQQQQELQQQTHEQQDLV